MNVITGKGTMVSVNENSLEFRSLRKRFVLIFLASNTLLIGILAAFISYSRSVLSEAVHDTVANSAKIGDYRQVLMTLDTAARKYEFEIVLQGPENLVLYQYEPVLWSKTFLRLDELPSLLKVTNDFVLERSGAEATKTLSIGFSIISHVPYFLVLLGVSSFIGLYFFNRFKRSFEESYKEKEGNLRNAAVASMVGAISHDVRKPFSLFKAVLDGIKQTKNPADLQEFAAMTLPEIERAMHSVDGLLTDVLQVSSTSNELVLENLNVARFVDACCLEIFRAQPEADVHIETKIDASVAISADESKLKRVFLNIIGNACQAIQWKGRIWVHACAQKGRVHFALGNAGSFIPAESLPQLFEAFFTSGKKGGTGLGLAIAKKWTEAHGGKISCTSFKDQANPNGVVEFHFDIAEATSTVAPFSDRMPAHSSGYRLEFTFGKSDADAATQQLAQELEAAIGSHEIRVAAIDDEPAYLKSIESVLGSLNQAGNLKLQTHAKGFSENLLHSLSADLYILDYDLGLPDLNGLDLIRAYRSAGGTGHICLHTNRADSETSRAAIEAGANTVYPKPIDAKHLVNLLKEVAQKIGTARAATVAATEPPTNKKPRIALVEDSFVMRLGWRGALANDCELSEFKSPEEFFAEPGAKYDLVITDMNFDNSQNTGVEVARFVHQNSVSSAVLLSSNGHYEDPEQLFAKQLDKNQTYSVTKLISFA